MFMVSINKTDASIMIAYQGTHIYVCMCVCIYVYIGTQHETSKKSKNYDR